MPELMSTTHRYLYPKQECIKHSCSVRIKRITRLSINQFISRHSAETRATVWLCRIKEKCLETDLKCVNGWSSSTVQWKRVPKSRNSNRETEKV